MAVTPKQALLRFVPLLKKLVTEVSAEEGDSGGNDPWS